jgi:predicted permease
MTVDNKHLFKISKYVYYEAFLDSQLQSQAMNQAKYLQDLEKNQKAVKIADIVMKISIGIMMGFVVMLPISAFNGIKNAIAQGLPANWVLLVGSLSFAIYFLVQSSYLLLFGMLLSSSLMSGEMFKWLYTLPVGKKDLRKIAYFTFFRGFDFSIVVLLLILPVATAIVTKSLIITLVTVGLSILSVLFSFSGLILLGERVHRVLMNNDVNSKKATLIRITTMLGYGLGSIMIIFIFQFAIMAMEEYFTSFSGDPDAINFINLILSIIPLPFAPAYLLSLSVMKTGISALVWFTSILGVLLFILLVIKMLKSALFKLENIVHTEQKNFEIAPTAKLEDVEIVSITPVKSFVKKDLSMASRDLQMMMFIIMPLILPSISIVSIAITGSMNEVDLEGSELMMLISMSTLYSMMGALMMIAGLLNVESTGASILSALPIVIRDQAKAKLMIMFPVVIIANIIPLFFYLGNPSFLTILAITLVFIPLGPMYGLSGLLLKVAMFGKMKYHYTLEEVNLSGKILKWIILFVVEIAGYIVILILTITIMESKGIPMMLGIVLAIEAGVLAICGFFFNKMFPTPKIYA